ncbi:thiol:disulfide interchange protein DsbA/DsbL [Luteimonas sp. BDR2-5]|uniref:thiol:disulfide interchange protein DsbA/DsbL n=1 Tax=Proluteimonas luteida TaxID=2878685 RepID=UPI001E64B013|nr:thiol:disulfide interchange protein DsbA/DsbL [Luteimonas sp. BDR2-5]MCD9029173.1 thiol:disulfide interchange protein DsbA/DsbL [Luteimonas sp. BDR2-5]
MIRPFRQPRLAALLCLLLPVAALLAPASAQTPAADSAPVGGALLEGRDYVPIPFGAPLAPQAGGIEVVEVFSYGCIHCFQFQSLLDPWLARQPDDVRFVLLPAAYSANDAFARGFFAAQELGLQRQTHHALFSAVHEQSVLPRGGAGYEAVAHWYAAHGAPSQAAFLAAMTSPATDEKMNQAHAFAVRSGVRGTPTLIINGRYRVQAPSLREALDVAGQLIARERAAR